MDNIDLSPLKAVAEARVAEEQQRAKAHRASSAGDKPRFVAKDHPADRPAASPFVAGTTATTSVTSSTSDTGARGSNGLPTVIELTEANFEAMMQLSNYVPIVIDLWAEWCQPCKQLTPVLEKLAAEYQGKWILAKANTEKEPVLAQAFKVQSVPTVVAMAKGHPLDAFAGAQPEPQLRGWLDALMNAVNGRLSPLPADGNIPGLEAFGGQVAADAVSEAAPATIVDQAEALADTGDYAAAEALLVDHLEHNPGDHAAESACALYQTLARAATTDEDTIVYADEHPADISAQCDAADREMTEVGAEAAFTRLLTTIARTTGEERAEARKHLVNLFAMCDPTDPLVIAARQQLASLLF